MHFQKAQGMIKLVSVDQDMWKLGKEYVNYVQIIVKNVIKKEIV